MAAYWWSLDSCNPILTIAAQAIRNCLLDIENIGELHYSVILLAYFVDPWTYVIIFSSTLHLSFISVGFKELYG
jgi:hypothetical protein